MSRLYNAPNVQTEYGPTIRNTVSSSYDHWQAEQKHYSSDTGRGFNNPKGPDTLKFVKQQGLPHGFQIFKKGINGHI